MSTHTYPVDGMTCGHCVSSITTEVSRLPGLHGVAGAGHSVVG